MTYHPYMGVVERFTLCYRTVDLSVCNTGVLWPNVWTDQDETWHAARPLPRPHCVRWDPAPPRKGAQQPPHSKFAGAGVACVRIIRGPCLLWPNGWMDQHETWHGGRPRPSPNCVKWRSSSPLPQGHPPQKKISHVCCG